MNTEQVDVIAARLARVDRPGYDPADINAGEDLLTGFAAPFGRETCTPRRPGRRRDQPRRHPHRRCTQHRPPAPGFRDPPATACTPASSDSPGLGAKLTALLTPLAAPADHQTPAPTETRLEQPDPAEPRATDARRPRRPVRPAAPRRHPTRRRRHPDHRDRHDQPSTTCSTGSARHDQRRHPMPTRELLAPRPPGRHPARRPHRAGAVLDLGRTRRIATPAQTYALIARDGGCSFPGCDHPPDGANATTSSPGSTADRPTSTT